jgi:hypothetical protein
MPRNGMAYLAHVAVLNDCVRKRTFPAEHLPVLTEE